MNEYLIVSDTHGNHKRLISLLYDHPNARAVLFLGDGLTDLAAAKLVFPKLICHAVRGNVDGCGTVFHGISCPDERVITLEGHRLFLAHGHLLGAGGSTSHLLAHGQAFTCEAILFGHTHVPLDIYDRITPDAPLCHLFNPGSLGRPLEGTPSYGILQIGDSGMLFSHGSL